MLLFRRQLGLGVVDLRVSPPVVPQVLEQGRRDRLEDRAFLGAEARLGPAVVGIFDDGIQAQVVVGVNARRTDLNPRIGTAGSRNPGVAVERIRQRLIHPRGVRDVVVEVDFGHTGELLTGDEFVEVHLEGLLVAHAGTHVRAIAFVSHGHIGQTGAPDFQIGVDVFEDDACRTTQSIAPTFLGQEHRPKSAAAARTTAGAWAAGAAGIHRQNLIEALAQRIGIEVTLLVPIPFRGPASESPQEFIPRHQGIVIGIQCLQPNRGHEAIGIESARTTTGATSTTRRSSEGAISTALGFQGLPLTCRKLEFHLPHPLQREQFR